MVLAPGAQAPWLGETHIHVQGRAGRDWETTAEVGPGGGDVRPHRQRKGGRFLPKWDTVPLLLSIIPRKQCDIY